MLPFFRIYLVALASLCCSATHATDVVVVCTPQWRPSLEPWVQLRQSQGLHVAFCEPGRTAEQTRDQISSVRDQHTRFVMLVGDATTIGQPREPYEVPAFYLPAVVTPRFGSTPTFPTDSPYATSPPLDHDNDQPFTTMAVGRLPVRSAAQLDQLVDRILRYEDSKDFGPWRRCLQLTGGIGGFGGFIDTAIESVTRTVLTSMLPIDVTPQIAYASQGHPFCPPDIDFATAVQGRYANGSRFWVYAGHGSVDRLDLLERSQSDAGSLAMGPMDDEQVRAPESTNSDSPYVVKSLIQNETVSRFSSPGSRAPIAVFLACYTGAIDAPGDCLAERMLMSEGGPVAIIAATRLTMPYGNARVGLGLLTGIYDTNQRRLGDAWVVGRTGLTPQPPAGPTPKPLSPVQSMVDALAGMMSPADVDLTIERTEHAGLYVLLGDPTLNLHPPQPMELDAEFNREVGESVIDVTIISPINGRLVVSVDRVLGGGPPTDAVATADDPHGLVLVQHQSDVEAGQTIDLRIPLSASEPETVVVRALVGGETNWASAAKSIAR
ncbi:MAG: C25 family cysteine peptidase [Planctomycetota bacterium]